MSPLGAFLFALMLETAKPDTAQCASAVYAVEVFCGCKRTKLTKRGYVARGCTWGTK